MVGIQREYPFVPKRQVSQRPSPLLGVALESMLMDVLREPASYLQRAVCTEGIHNVDISTPSSKAFQTGLQVVLLVLCQDEDGQRYRLYGFRRSRGFGFGEPRFHRDVNQ